MNTNREFERIVSDWLQDRVVDPPHGSLAVALERADAVAQERHWWQRWWLGRRRGQGGGATTSGGSTPSKDRHDRLMFSAAAVVAVAVLVIVATAVMPRGTVEPITPAISGTVHTVADEGGDFSTIGEAVAAAEEGDTVLVGPGTYREALIIDKDITLASSAEPPRETVLAVPADAPVPVVPLPPYDRRSDVFIEIGSPLVGIQVVDSDATIRDLRVVGNEGSIALLVLGGAPTLEGLTLTHAGPVAPSLDLAGALFVEDGSTASIHGLDVWYRVRVSGGSALTISDSDFHSTDFTIQGGSSATIAGGVISGGCECSWVTVVGGSSVTLRDNWFSQTGLKVRGHDGDGTSAIVEMNAFNTNAETAVLVSDTATATITGNRFVGNERGLEVIDATAEVRDNSYVNNWKGATFEDADVEFTDNVIEKGAFGVSVISSGSPVIRGNTIEDASTRGIFVADGTSPVIEGNSICGSPVNLYVAPEAEPTIGDNDICPDGVAPDG